MAASPLSKFQWLIASEYIRRQRGKGEQRIEWQYVLRAQSFLRWQSERWRFFRQQSQFRVQFWTHGSLQSFQHFSQEPRQ